MPTDAPAPVLSATTSALCYSLAREHAGSHPALAPPYNDVVRFVSAQRVRLSPALRGPLVLATLAFGLAGLRRGRRFHRQTLEGRARQIAAWRGSRLGPLRDLVRFYESLSVLALFARPELAAWEAPDEPPPARAA